MQSCKTCGRQVADLAFGICLDCYLICYSDSDIADFYYDVEKENTCRACDGGGWLNVLGGEWDVCTCCDGTGTNDAAKRRYAGLRSVKRISLPELGERTLELD